MKCFMPFRHWFVWAILLSALMAFSESSPIVSTNNDKIVANTNRVEELLLYDPSAHILREAATDDPAFSSNVSIFKSRKGVRDESAEKIARKSVPIFFAEKDGEYTLRDRTHDDGIHSLTLSSGYLTAFGRYLGNGEDQTSEFALPVLKMSIDYDEATGEYDVNSLGIGFFNERLWLLHEFGNLDDETGTYGIQLRKKW